MATPDYRPRDTGDLAGTPPAPSEDDDLDLAVPDTLAAFGDADTGRLGAGSLYDPTEDPALQGQHDVDLAPEANYGDDALDDAELADAATLDARRRDLSHSTHNLGGIGEHGASDEILGDLTGDDESFGPGSGTLGDTNSPSDEL